jgi:hypothetical protein
MADGVRRFVTGLRWAAGVFGAVCVVGVVVLAIRAPDCLGIGVSVFGAEDCTNRETYYLLLAASAAIVAFLCMLVFACAYAIELLGVMAHERDDHDG